jgi:putative NADPH-quinone reductase
MPGGGAEARMASVILAHPYEKSFNHAIFAAAKATLSARGVSVFAHDLYAEGFDPVLTRNELGKEETEDPLAARYIRELIASDILVFIHPNWWGQPPAIMKGYIDRVFRPPYAYDYEVGKEGSAEITQKLAGKIGIVFNTSNTGEARENGYFHDPLEHEWLKCVFGFCGIERRSRRMFRIVADSSAEERAGWLEQVKDDIEAFL